MSKDNKEQIYWLKDISDWVNKCPLKSIQEGTSVDNIELRELANNILILTATLKQKIRVAE